MARSGGRPDSGGGRRHPADDALQGYIDDIAAEYRPLFDRLQGLILGAYADVTVGLSYGMPTYRRGGRRLHLGVWKHGVSLYGWQKEKDRGFVSRHPDLKTSTGTIRLRPRDAAEITDQEFADLIRAALDTG